MKEVPQKNNFGFLFQMNMKHQGFKMHFFFSNEGINHIMVPCHFCKNEKAINFHKP